MCTTIGFSYVDGMCFGRTLEVGIQLDHKILFVPSHGKGFIQANDITYDSKYSVLGTGFYNIASFGDGINEMGLMGSNNLFPGYASFAPQAIEGQVNLTTSHAFNYLLSRCKDVAEVKAEAKNITITEFGKDESERSTSMHFFFMDAKGNKVVLEPIDGTLVCFDNPYGVLTNAPGFDWHTTNLKNYIHLSQNNIDSGKFNDVLLPKLGEGTGMMGLPGDFTPPSRFVRAAYFVSNTQKT